MNEFKIEKNIPMPVKRGLIGAMLSMEIGDSLLLPNSQRSVPSRISTDGSGKKFIVRRVDPLTFRMWRVA